MFIFTLVLSAIAVSILAFVVLVFGGARSKRRRFNNRKLIDSRTFDQGDGDVAYLKYGQGDEGEASSRCVTLELHRANGSVLRSFWEFDSPDFASDRENRKLDRRVYDFFCDATEKETRNECKILIDQGHKSLAGLGIPGYSDEIQPAK
jgi:hypothetical protein